MSRLALLAAGLLLTATSVTYAQDITGVITASGAFEYERFDGEDWEEVYGGTIKTRNGSISAKLGVVVADNVTVQFDAWASRSAYEIQYDGDSPGFWNELDLGGAAHLTYHAGDYLIGVVGGLGRSVYDDNPDWYDIYGTLAVEGGYSTEELSVIGQAGLSTDLESTSDYAPFASVTATYYLTPNFSVSAYGLATSRVWEGYEDDVDYRGAVGTQLRYKLDDSPLVLSLGYRFAGQYATDVEDDDSWTSTQHRVTAGISIPFGAGSTTLRDLDRATGLGLTEAKYSLDRL